MYSNTNRMQKYNRRFKNIYMRIFEYLKLYRVFIWLPSILIMLHGYIACPVAPGNRDWQKFFTAFFALALMNGTNNALNCVFDKDTDRFKGTTLPILSLVSSRKIILFITATALLSTIMFILVNIWFLVLGVIGLCMGVLYSAPPLRIKARPYFDVVLNILGYGPVSYLMGCATASGEYINTASISIGISLGLAVGHFTILFSVADIKYDSRANLATTAVTLGPSASMMLAQVLLLLSILGLILCQRIDLAASSIPSVMISSCAFLGDKWLKKIESLFNYNYIVFIGLFSCAIWGICNMIIIAINSSNLLFIRILIIAYLSLFTTHLGYSSWNRIKRATQSSSIQKRDLN
jgi:4-hydroxybenzoate polyprenyltransferase